MLSRSGIAIFSCMRWNRIESGDRRRMDRRSCELLVAIYGNFSMSIRKTYMREQGRVQEVDKLIERTTVYLYADL